MSSSTKIDNRKKDISVLGKGPTQGLELTLIAEKMYSINVTENNKNFCLSLHYNKENSDLFVNATEIIKFKSKDPEVLAHLLCLGNISKDWPVHNMKKKTGLNGYNYDFSDAIDDILDIHEYLKKKNNIIQKCLGLLMFVFIIGLTILSSVNLLNTVPLNAIPLRVAPLNATPFKCVSMTNQESKVRPKIINVNGDDPVFFPFCIKTSKCSGSCNNINNPLAILCVLDLDVVKNLNVKCSI